MTTETFTIPKISCKHCVMAVKNELLELDGVAGVDGDPETKSITVDFSAPVTRETLLSTLEEINYPAE